MDKTSTHPDKGEREKENAETEARRTRARHMYAMAEAVAQVRTVSQLEVKYGLGSVNRANVKPDASEILSVLGILTVFMGCGMRLPEDGQPTNFFEAIKEENGIGADAARSILEALADKLGSDKPRDEIHDMHMKEFGHGASEG